MASSRNSTNRTEAGDWIARAERALKDFLARVCFSGTPPSVAVAYSGGLDSSLLLHLVQRFSQSDPQSRTLKVFAFHIHHGLNPQADSWLAHCEQIARSYGVAFAARRVTVDRDSGLGVEESARRERYAALGGLCREYGVPLLLTAHHEDDQAETVMMQLLRGAGLPGLSGMPPYTEQHDLLGTGVALGRPLLSVSRSALEREAVRLAIPHIVDESNADVAYRRNAVRHRVMPAVREVFPSYGSCISRSSAHAQQAQRLLDELAGIDLDRCGCGEDQGELDIRAVKALSEDRADNLLRFWLHRHGRVLPSHAQLQQIRLQMLEAAPDREPYYRCGELQLRRIGHRIVVDDCTATPPEQSLALTWQGEAHIEVPEWRGRLVFQEGAQPGIDTARLRAGPIVLHPRSGQERLKLAPNRPAKTLKNLYQEVGVFPAERRWMPLVSLRNQLIFAAGLGMDVRHLDVDSGVRLCWEKL